MLQDEDCHTAFYKILTICCLQKACEICKNTASG